MNLLLFNYKVNIILRLFLTIETKIKSVIIIIYKWVKCTRFALDGFFSFQIIPSYLEFRIFVKLVFRDVSSMDHSSQILIISNDFFVLKFSFFFLIFSCVWECRARMSNGKFYLVLMSEGDVWMKLNDDVCLSTSTGWCLSCGCIRIFGCW